MKAIMMVLLLVGVSSTIFTLKTAFILSTGPIKDLHITSDNQVLAVVTHNDYISIFRPDVNGDFDLYQSINGG